MPRSASKPGKGGKSSKTARVLSLLTDPSSAQDNAPASDAADMSAARPEEETVPAQRLDDRAAQEQIRDALVSELFGKKAKPARPAGQARAAGDIPQTQAAPPRRNPSAAPEDEETQILNNTNETEVLNRNAGTERLDYAASRVPEDTVRAPGASPEPDPAPRSPDPAPRSPDPAPRNPSPAVSAHTPEAAERPAAERPAAEYAVQEWDWQPPTVTLEKPEPETQRPAAPPETRPAQVRAPAAKPALRPENDYICFNLTQALVEDKADKYMHLFGMCTCQRCKVDVTAIALSNLPSKYVATQSRDVIPLLSMYEGKYSAAVIAQVMSACKIVMSRPHHGRN